MPFKVRACQHPGCPNTTSGRYCELHVSHAVPPRRPGMYRQYGRQWVAIRNRYISAHPLCERCLEAGRYTPAQEVHHIRPLDRGGDHSDENLQSLCKPCHSFFTMTENNSRRTR